MTKTSKSTAMIRRRKQKSSCAAIINRVRDKISSGEEKEHGPQSLVYNDIVGSSTIQKMMSSDKTILLGLLVIRLVNALIVQTFFVPDEFWQSVEVAHKMAFNYGYLTWEWRAGIRSYSYPLVFAMLYQVLGIFGLDNRVLLVKLPRLLQGVFASIGDLYLFHLSRRLAGADVAQWTLLCQMLSWFTAYCCTRTLTNSTETVLVTAALYYFPWPGHTQNKSHTRRFVWLAAASVVVRPTAGIMWLLLCSWHLQQSKGAALYSTIRLYLTAGLTILGLASVVDRVWYGRWVFVHYNFLYFNVVSGGSAFYGSHPWHWYFSQGLPIVLGSHLLPFLLGARQADNKVLLLLIVWTVGILSFLSHKEMRFLLPVLPLAMHYCGIFFHSISVNYVSKVEPVTTPLAKSTCMKDADLRLDVFRDGVGDQDRPAFTPVRDGNQNEDCVKHSFNEQSSNNSAQVHDSNQREDCVGPGFNEQRSNNSRQRVRRVKYLVVLLSLSNLVPFLYFALIHQRGTVDVMNHLHDVVRTYRNNNTKSLTDRDSAVDILFLMPCHSTPYYSFLHVNISMRFLTCEPNLNHTSNYIDEADIFFQDPMKWLNNEFDHSGLPTHIVYYNCLQDHINIFLHQNMYRQCATFFHTHIPEGRIGSHIVVSCR